MLCEACSNDDHDNCGMQTWCQCDCEGSNSLYIPEGYYLNEDLDGCRLVKKEIKQSKEAPCDPKT